jgi:polyribonucleotide nucleotidyltransferase
VQAARVERPFGSSTLSLETGKLAKQAHGAVVVRYGDTVTITTAVEGAVLDRDGVPLNVDYREKTYAAGKFPGGFIKREGRPSTKEILTSRLIDRPIRPLFPDGYLNEVQVLVTVLSADKENDPDVLSMIGASAALHVSQIPFLQVTGSVRVGRVGGQLVLMPSHSQLEESDLDLVVAGTHKAVTMIEGFAREMSEADMLEAILFAHKHIVTIVDMIDELRQQAGLGTKEYPEPKPDDPVIEEIHKKYYADFRKAKLTTGKQARAEAAKAIKEKAKEEFLPEEGDPKTDEKTVNKALYRLEERVVRDLLLEGQRLDGRAMKQIRALQCDVSVLPRTHGSAVFQRGETQALVITTLGTSSDEQRVDGLGDEYSKKFMLDYNFPPSSVGECKPVRGPGRREIGHGALAERSLRAVIPPPTKFPYTIRLVSEILESNGSSSMASVCGGTLALMDAGVPITDPVAGISIGLVKEPDRFILLTDIMGDEDHFADMDFKVAGTGRGITGIQLDLKIDGIGEEIIRGTLEQAREARREILRSMLGTLRQPRAEISPIAPRLLTLKINPDKIGALIGPGGKNIKSIQETTGAKIDVEDDGTVYISHSDSTGAEAARLKVEAITEEVRIGRIYEGRVTTIKDFGAFIEILPGREGLCHVSELDVGFVQKPEDVVKLGDRLQVKVIAIDEHDRVKLSRKAVLRDQAGGGTPGAPGEPAAAPQGTGGYPEGGGREPREHREPRESRGPRDGGRGGGGSREGRGGGRGPRRPRDDRD